MVVRRRVIAILSIGLSISAWGWVIVLPESRLHSGAVFATLNALAACAAAAGLIASRQNKYFILWRLISDAGLILGLVFVVLGIVSLIMFLKGIEFV